MAMTYRSVLMLIEYMKRYRIGFGRIGSKLNVSLFGVRFTMARSRLHTRLLFKHTTMVMAHGFALMLIEYMERCHVDFEKTACTLVLVYV